MQAKNSRKTAHLALDRLAADPRLAHLLPPEVAYRFHALPVAQDGGRLTVVMADPDDPEARSAIAGVLGSEPCVVQGDAAIIDALLAGVWEAEGVPALRIRVCAPVAAGSEDVWGYARALAGLLDARLDPQETGMQGDRWLVILPGEPAGGGQPVTLPGYTAVPNQEGPLVRGVLVVGRPRWPLRSILLVVGGSQADDEALAWALRLAQPAACQVVVLAVVPPPATAEGRSAEGQGLPALLSADTSLGRRLRHVACQLAEHDVAGSIRVRQGPPDWQIRRELAEGDHDLVVVGQQPGGQEPGEPEHDPAVGLLRWGTRPTLVAWAAPE